MPDKTIKAAIYEPLVDRICMLLALVFHEKIAEFADRPLSPAFIGGKETLLFDCWIGIRHAGRQTDQVEARGVVDIVAEIGYLPPLQTAFPHQLSQTGCLVVAALYLNFT